jgi:DNA repair exonuclease SbcCD nuclease subunit
MDDPTAWIPPRDKDERDLRIGLAHGTMRLRDDMGQDDFPIPLDTPARRGLEYLALGHWHSTLSSPCGCAWYCGTPETTKFGERESGNMLIVKLTSPGQKPQVESVRSGVLNWREKEMDLDGGGVDELMRELREWPAADKCLLNARLKGTLTPQNAARLRELDDLLRQRFLYYECDRRGLRPPAGETALADLAGSPYLLNAAEELGTLAGAGPANEAAVARRALEMLHEAQWETRLT